MDEIIVLGLIPGTQIQITFIAWLIIAGGLSAFLLARLNSRTLSVQGWLIATSIMLATQRHQPEA